ncbi:MAG TPA: hypothetical protein VNL15_00180 [Dehalococcoidia bacterium]|nr:hypothetical protein [Dehalococcoidia bacterium]
MESGKLLKSEFAAVIVEVKDNGRGPRLMIKDARTDQAIFLDPLELESLAWRKHADLRSFLDPGQGRWRDLPQDTLPEMLKDVDVDL